MQKAITSLLIEGATIITIDNITGRLQSRHLDAVLTSDMWRGRILGVSKMTLVPQRATWLATGNNIKLGGDIARRCYRIRLDAKVSRPFMRKNFTHSDLVTWVSEQRADLVGALLTLARAWYAAGKPEYAHLPSLGTFSGWVKIVGGILEYAGIPGFLANLEQLYDDADEESAQWEAFLQAWYRAFGEDWISVATVVHAITASSDAGGEEGISDNGLGETLPEALQLALKEKPHSFKVRLGKALDKRVDTCFGEENFRLEKTRNTHSKTSQWRVVAGDAGSYSAPTRSDSEESLNQTCEENSNRIGWDKTTHPTQGDDTQKASICLQTGAKLDSPSLYEAPKNEPLPPSPARESQREVHDL